MAWLWRPSAPKGFSDDSAPWLDGLLEDDERVIVDVLVPVVLVDLQLEHGEFRQDVGGEPGVDQDRQALQAKQDFWCGEIHVSKLN